MHQAGDIIAQRYRITDILNQGSFGHTYAAEDIGSAKQVVIKERSLRHIKDWKTLQLFEREAQVLAQLNHPAIPRYLDYFELDIDNSRCFYLVQELASGKSLAALIEQGWHPNEMEVRQIAIQILEVLQYLQQLIPPVIHRDIKPENIILCDDGKVFLVDFGAVQDMYQNTLMSSTVVGTYGYMAPEQFRGKAVLASDLYGLGTTLIYLLTRQFPSDLPQRRLKIHFQSYVKLEKVFANWLKRMIEPLVEDRFASASEALAVLQGTQSLNSDSNIQKLDLPTFSKIRYSDDDDKLAIEIPPIWFSTSESLIFAFLTILCFVCSCWLALGILGAPNYALVNPILWVYSLFYAGYGLYLLIFLIKAATLQIHLKFKDDNFQIQQWLLGWHYQHICGKTWEMSEWQLTKTGFSTDPDTSISTRCTFRIKKQKYEFGIFLNKEEKKWLVAQVNNFLLK